MIKTTCKIISLILCVAMIIPAFTACNPLSELISSSEREDAQSYALIQDTVLVSVAGGKGYSVDSSNPLLVMRGTDAVFKITVDEDYEYESASADVIFERGVLTVKNVQFPITIELFMEKKSTSVDIIIPPITDDPTIDEPTVDDPTADDPTTDDPTMDDPTADDPTTDDPTTDEPTTDDTHEHIDENLDHVCDNGCDTLIGICEDANKDHACDYGCEKMLGSCADEDKNHVCDYGCEKIHGEHLDGDDENHLCDYGCGLIADDGCYENDVDGICDECGADMSHTCIDENKNHACDICSANVGEHKDENLDHICDYGCQNAIGSCVDSDKNHKCDYGCEKAFGSCTDEDKNKECDYCGEHFIGECSDHTDIDRDKKCDYCSVDYIAECTEHIDEDENLNCDYCLQDFIPEFVTADLAPDAADGFKFICWTIDKPAKEGGEVLTTEEAGKFRVPYGRDIIANYVETDFDVILYRTNGGKVSETGADFYYQTVSNKNYYLPNTLYQNGTFVRDGYQLLHYSENANGRGTYTTLGGNIEPNKNGFVELYLVWAKNTTSGLVFTAAQKENGEYYAQISKYNGAGGAVVIPEYITATVGGEAKSIKVERILAGAFANSEITSLALPVSIHTVEDGAFKNCTELQVLYLHDNVYQLKDEAFTGCKIPKIYLNAGRLPAHHTGAEGMNAYKYDKIREAAAKGQKKIIVFSGSSSLYGFRAEDVYNAFEGEYAVINFGNNAGTLSPLYMEAFSAWYGEGDIIIHAPETSGTQNGDKNLGTSGYITFRGSEGMYEIFSYVDMSEVKGFFTGLTVFNQEKRNTMPGSGYENIGKSINEYTDLTSNKDNFEYKSTTTNNNPFNLAIINAARAKHLNSVYDKVAATGAKVYRSFAPINKNSCSSASKDPANQAAFVKAIEDNLHITVISNPADYMFDQQYFNNSDYHPGITGSKMRTAQLVADVKAQLEREAAGQ